MSCNSNKTASANFTSVAGVIETIEMATPLAYAYPDSLDIALIEMKDVQAVVPSIRYGVQPLTDSINEYLYPIIIERYLPGVVTQYPYLNERVNGTNGGSTPGRISYTELADFLDYASYTDVPKFNAGVTLAPEEVTRLLNRYYEEQMSGSAVSLCSLLSNPFEQVAGLLEMIEGLTSGILTHLPSIASRLKAFAEMMKDTVANLFTSLQGMVANIGSMAQDMVAGLANAPAAIAGIAQQFSNQFASLQNMLSEANLANIQEGIDKFVTKAVLQFQKILENPQVLLYLLYMFCKATSFIEQSLQSPVNAFRQQVSNVSHEQNVLKVKSAPRTQKAIEAGRPTATQEAVNEIRAQKAMSHNNAVSANGADQVPDTTKIVWTPEHTTHPPPSSWSHLAFAASVINNDFWTRDENVRMDREFGGGTVNVKSLGLSKATGYYGCKLEVLEMLNKVGQILGQKLTVNSAFRHPVYNQYLRRTTSGVAKHSNHMKGIALDVSMSGVNRRAFVAAAKKVGFRGIGYYRTFIHVDTGTARSWGGGSRG